jgi:hypothetical protein
MERPIINVNDIQKGLLNVMCSKSGDCMTFGRFVDTMNAYFDNMNFQYLVNPIKRIGSPSKNGFVNELVFEREGYKNYCVLKSSTKLGSDNLAYEYYVGKHFVNKYIKLLPCFLETYKICSYKNNYSYSNMMNNKENETSVLQGDNQLKSIENIDEYVLESCIDSRKLCILIQHLENPISLNDFCLKNNYTNLILFQFLLQIYLPLGKLMDAFVHNDLHGDNVLLYKVPNNNYVELIYVLEDGSEIKLKTNYIVKLIDYGRCYFNNTFNETSESTDSSQGFYNFVKQRCKNPLQHIKIMNKNHTGRDVGDSEILQHMGYGFFDQSPSKHNYYISSLNGSNAKDLWLLLVLKRGNYVKKISDIFDEKFQELFSRMVFNVEPVDFNDIGFIDKNRDSTGKATLYEKTFYSGKSVKTEQCPTNDICNVKMFSDELVKLYNYFKEPILNFNNKVYESVKQVGVMKVYMDLTREMDFQMNKYEFKRPILTNQQEIDDQNALELLLNKSIPEHLPSTISQKLIQKKRKIPITTEELQPNISDKLIKKKQKITKHGGKITKRCGKITKRGGKIKSRKIKSRKIKSRKIKRKK